MKQRKLDEPQAYRRLPRKAMNENKRIETAAALPEREVLAELLGTTLDAEQRVHLSAGGRLATRGGERTICACFGGGLQTLHKTILSRQLTTVGEIGRALRAGTNCGSCIPELNAVLREVRFGRPAAA